MALSRVSDHGLKARELDMITFRNRHSGHTDMTLLPVTLSVLDMIIV